MKTFLLVVLSTIGIWGCSDQNKDVYKKIMLTEGWFIKSSLEVKEPGEIVSTEGFDPVGWYRTSVPTTVLNALIKNKIYPDPRFGMNNFEIPDVSDDFNAKYDLAKYSYLKDKKNPWKEPYWFRTEFTIPKNYAGRQLFLNFDCINYRADVWLNGKKIADQKEMVGMFQRFKFNITSSAKTGRENYLAVKIYQVDHPGTPDPGIQNVVFGKNRGHSVDLFKDETLKMSGGWDCAPVVRDRNMGICQYVYITSSGMVTIENPCVATDLPLPDTTSADVRITVELSNMDNTNISGYLTGEINLIDTLKFPTYNQFLGGNLPVIHFKKTVNLKAGETMEIVIDSKEFTQLRIKNPYLWWPNGYGKQYLHRLKLSYVTPKGVSDIREITFGIREITNELKKIRNEYGRVFYINGKRVFCRGGWIQPDILLDMNEKRIYDEARLLAEANVNMLGNEDAPSPADAIMDAYDKYGLMVWEVFYQCWRMYPGSETANNPVDHDLAIREARDIIKRYRNHPSLVIWCAANEVTVAEDLYRALRKSVKELDTMRPFIPCTSYSWDVDKLTPYIKDDLPLGTTDDGTPDYNWNPEPYYFDKVEEVTLQTFRNEMGAPALPTYGSLQKFIPSLGKAKKSPVYPLDSIWAEHGAWDDNNYVFRAYDHAIRTIYGEPLTAVDYVQKAQYVSANSYRAMFEAANHRMWDITSGVMLWKLNSCWPDVGWQMYDWFLNPTSAYYFAKKAMEPVHIQMNANNLMISAINTRHTNFERVTMTAKIIDFNLHTRWEKTDTFNLEQDRYKELMALPRNLVLTPVYFLKLVLSNTLGNILSENFYWLSSKNPPDLTDLNKLRPVDLVVTDQVRETDKEYRIAVTLKNPSGKLSFFNRLFISRENGGEEVNPVFWDNNFVSLMPGEKITLNAVVSKADMHEAKPIVNIERK